MFGKPSEKPRRTMATSDYPVESVLQEGVRVRGDLEARGNVRLDGSLEGRVSAADVLTIGATGSITADLEAAEVVVMGTVEGSIVATSRIELRKGARVLGDISAPSLIIEEGVFFEGQCRMTDPAGDGEILPIDKDTPDQTQYAH